MTPRTAPEPGQIRTVVRRFHERRPQEVACLQGVLDYYNSPPQLADALLHHRICHLVPRHAAGLARLGFVVPLGGTTLFFRRAALEELGGWDAHNVTEDADLGLRLARHGYRTELVATVTEEEPNGAVVPWIKQRSRWQKGYAITWAVHMRDPLRLWRELGAKRFIGVQIIFLGSLSQSVLAPVLWSFWLAAFGLNHPVVSHVPGWAVAGLSGLFVLSEVLNIAVGLWAVRGRGHRHLLAWVPTLHVYFPLGALASYKALWEVVRKPFFWDKTRHGVLDGAEGAAGGPAILPVLILTDPILPEPPAAPDNVIHLLRASAPPRPRLSEIAFAPARPAIEFQPSFEGF